MSKPVLWLLVVASAIAAVSVAIARYSPASSALKRFMSPGALSAGHAYLADRCDSCHVTNVGVTVTKCTGCHANDERLLGRQPTAFHASVGECATCHVEHQGASTRMIAMNHLELARVGARALASASQTDPASAATLHSLGTWLRIRIPGQLSEGSAAAALNCLGCHATKDRHLGLFGNDCAQCHAMAKWTIPEFRHPSPRSTTCAQCHQAPPSHYMMHFQMISKKLARQDDAQTAGCCGPTQVNQCYKCHQTTSWNDIRGVGYYKHH